MEYPHLEFELPTSHYQEGEASAVVMLPATGGQFEVELSPLPTNVSFNTFSQNNRLVLGLEG